MDFLGIGWGEILLIIVVAVIFVGPGKIVDFARTLGKFFYNIRKLSSSLTAQITREMEEQKKNLSDPVSEVKPSIISESRHEQR